MGTAERRALVLRVPAGPARVRHGPLLMPVLNPVRLHPFRQVSGKPGASGPEPEEHVVSCER